MSIEQKPFIRYNEEKKDDSFAVKLSKDGTERRLLEDCKKILQQPKDSTALKQLAWIGAEVILDQKVRRLLEAVTGNKRKNTRLGIHDFD